MTMTSGFFDSVDHDRRYTALQWGQIMDYLITDGVYHRYPETGVETDDTGKPRNTLNPFEIRVTNDHDSYFNPTSPAISIGPGRAWFDHTWTWVQTPEFIDLPDADPVNDRLDILVLTMDKSVPVRQNYFRIIQGPANDMSFDPTNKDDLTRFGLQGLYMHNDDVHDVPFATIKRKASEAYTSDALTAADITSLVGQGQAGYVGNVAEGSFSTTALFEKYNETWNEFLEQTGEEYDAWLKLFGDPDSAMNTQWADYLNEKSADFMRFLKMQDRAYHVWYQGSVNWTYEYIRNLNAENEEFESKWKTAIQKAQSLLENGFTEYTQKIDEILRKFDDIDNLADSQMSELEKRVDAAIAGLEGDFDAQMRQYVKEAVTAEMELVVNQVVEQMSPSILESMQAEVQQLVEDELSSSFEDRLKGLETDLEQYKDEVLESSKRQLEQEITSFNAFQNDLQARIEKALEDYLTADGNLQDALDKVAEEALANQVRQQWSEVQETWSEEIQDTLYEQLARDINFLFVECFEEEEEKLIEWIKSQLQPLTQEAVDTRFNADFQDKQTELENRIDSAITKGLENVDQRLLDLAADPEFIAKVVAAIPIVSTDGPGLAPQIPSE